MKNQTIMNRKSAKKLLMVQWSRFQNVCIELEGSTLVTGVNGSGKSTVLDAMTYLLTGNTQFNKAAKDRDRTVLGYVRGDTRSNGEARYLRAILRWNFPIRRWDSRSRSEYALSLQVSLVSRSAAGLSVQGRRLTISILHGLREMHSASRRKMS